MPLDSPVSTSDSSFSNLSLASFNTISAAGKKKAAAARDKPARDAANSRLIHLSTKFRNLDRVP